MNYRRLVAAEKGKLKALREEVALLRRAMDQAPSMLSYWDSEQRCQLANAAYERWRGATPGALLGKTLSEVLGPAHAQIAPRIEAVLRGEAQRFEQETTDGHSGARRRSECAYLPDVEKGVTRGFFATETEIAERPKAEPAPAAATHDVLTGLPARLLLEDRIHCAIELAKRHRRRCGLMSIEVEGLRAEGGAPGDEVLREVARRLRASLRKSDTVARLGGDELHVLLPEVGQREVAAMVARRLLTILGRDPYAVSGASLVPTFAVGVALCPDDGADTAQLLSCAQTAQRAAKRQGKNEFAFYAQP